MMQKISETEGGIICRLGYDACLEQVVERNVLTADILKKLQTEIIFRAIVKKYLLTEISRDMQIKAEN